MKKFKISADKMKVLITTIITLLVGVAYTSAQSEEATKILFIGNSYTHMNNMPKLFDKIASSKGMNVDVEMDARSSHTFEMHSKRPEMFERIRSKQWDYVVLQGFSRELSFDQATIDSASIPYLDMILDSIYANNSCTKVLLYMTWGYREGFSKREEINSYAKMTDSVKKGYMYVSNKYNLPISPVGYVYKSIRSLTDINLYDEDSQHPNDYGSFVIASTHYVSIFKSSPSNSFYKGMTKQEANTLQDITYDYVMNNLEEYKLREHSHSIMFDWSEKGKLLANVTADYPMSIIRWEFGDGDSTDDANSSHEYKKLRPYTLSLIVQDSCGVKSFQHRISFSQLPEPPPEHPKYPRIMKELMRAKKRKRFG